MLISLWKTLNDWVLDGFKKTYARMGIKFDKIYFESETYLGGRELVLEALNKGICQQETNGAISLDLEAENLGKKILLRGDGTFRIHDTGISIRRLGNSRITILTVAFFVVGNEQDNHFLVSV